MRMVEHREKWAVRFQGKRYSTGVPFLPENREAAERKAREILTALTKTNSGENCREIVAAYLADMPNRADPKVASESYRYAARGALAFFGDHQPHEVTREECRAFIAQRRAKGLSDGTTRKELSVLQAALNWKDKATPAAFDFPSPPPPRDRWLTRDEFGRVLAAADTPHIKTFLHVAICTGARKEAILQLQWETHIDFERRTIWPGFKAGGKNRAQPIPMTDAAYEWLKTARLSAQTPFVCEWAGKGVKNNKKALARAYRLAGVEVKAQAHVLRHTAGAWMAIAGVPIFEISRRLGHSSIRVTEKHYAHLHPDYMGASTKALEI